MNARDAMPAGGDVRLRASNVVVTDGDDVSAAPGEYVLLEVEDDGVGMPPEVAVQAFEPFFTTKPEGLGTGLGLSMVYGFVLQSGGHVRLLTEPGSGTTVQIYLQQSSERPSEPAAERRADDVVRGNEELILVVEDNEMVRSLTVELLEHLGYRTVAADGADAALAHLSSDADISLMLTDLVLPGPIDGFALSQRARVLRPGMRVLFVSGYPKDVLAGRGADDVTYDLLMKPFTTQQLADAVDRQTSGTAAETL